MKLLEIVQLGWDLEIGPDGATDAQEGHFRGSLCHYSRGHLDATGATVELVAAELEAKWLAQKDEPEPEPPRSRQIYPLPLARSKPCTWTAQLGDALGELQIERLITPPQMRELVLVSATIRGPEGDRVAFDNLVLPASLGALEDARGFVGFRLGLDGHPLLQPGETVELVCDRDLHGLTMALLMSEPEPPLEQMLTSMMGGAIAGFIGQAARLPYEAPAIVETRPLSGAECAELGMMNPTAAGPSWTCERGHAVHGYGFCHLCRFGTGAI